jgi:asparagine synthase (glutamine-hydrolysing)
MGGIVGLLNLDGAPVDRALLERMTTYMTFRGPDAQTVWAEGAVGLGHAMLCTTWEAEYEHQPFTLDQQVWIVADARIDDRETLAQKLGIGPLPTYPFGSDTTVITDVELILRAYLQWGEACVHHLLGDFAFAIWDGYGQRLFCARDPFGVKPFYYSQVKNRFIFSNTLNCLRQHPQVSDTLNEAAIGDFLLFDTNYNLATTTFADIQRLPSAHILNCTAQQFITQQYWTLQLPKLLRYQNPQDYIDHFKTLMAQAVDDRLRTTQVASFFSGGLDSTTIAATALALAQRNKQSLDLKAFTIVYDSLIPDRERYYSQLAATHLGLAIDYLVADDYEVFQDWQTAKLHTPEPYNDPFLLLHWDTGQRVATHSRVALNGNGGDESLASIKVLEMLKTMPPWEVGQDVFRSYFIFGTKPTWGSGLLNVFNQWRQKDNGEPSYPTWLNPDFAQALNLEQRWIQIMDTRKETIFAPRFRSYQRLTLISWAAYFEANDPGYSGLPVELRFPFIDLRLLNYLLALPPLPWCMNKMLLRTAMKQVLPEEIRLRPKAPQAGDPLFVKGVQRIDQASTLEELSLLEPYVNLEEVLSLNNSNTIWNCWEQVRPISLAYWLHRYRNTTAKSVKS